MPTLVSEPPTGDGWLHEIEHDGYRTLLLVEGGCARAFTRNRHDWSEQYASICTAATALPCRSALIDGEIIFQDEDGRADFGALRSAIRFAPERLVFIAWAGATSAAGRSLSTERRCATSLRIPVHRSYSASIMQETALRPSLRPSGSDWRASSQSARTPATAAAP